MTLPVTLPIDQLMDNTAVKLFREATALNNLVKNMQIDLERFQENLSYQQAEALTAEQAYFQYVRGNHGAQTKEQAQGQEQGNEAG